MRYLGAHMSIAGGMHLAFDRLGQIRGNALQIFTANQRRWLSGKLDDPAIELFKSRWEQSGWIPVAAHASYLINLAALDRQILSRSIDAFAEELMRCDNLGIRYLIMHPGAHVGAGVEAGLIGLVKNLDRSIEVSGVESVSVLIENTAGQGSSLGSSFEEIGFILQNSRFGETMGVCYDTSHGFAAGYDMGDERAYKLTISKFDETIGIGRIAYFHVNDSARELGSRVDRHEHIGKGKIGLNGFMLMLNDPGFHDLPMVLETPKGKDLEEDKTNMGVLRSLMRN
ncbi:MAG: deoxyribonuclease IV [Syntrophobacteraceae bacterium]